MFRFTYVNFFRYLILSFFSHLPTVFLLISLSCFVCPTTLHPTPSSSRFQVHDECDMGWKRLVIHRRRLPRKPKAGGHCSQQGERMGKGSHICVSIWVSLCMCFYYMLITNSNTTCNTCSLLAGEDVQYFVQTVL